DPISGSNTTDPVGNCALTGPKSIGGNFGRVLYIATFSPAADPPRSPYSMEPPSLEPRRRGTLENPEVLEDVPGHIIPILEQEFDDFDNEAAKFLGGETPETEFIGFRLKQGVYGQRQADVQMIRVKLPFGGI